jgi:EpsI family protein
MKPLLAWAPAALLGAGAILTVGTRLQRELPLRLPLGAAVPDTIAGQVGRDLTLDERELAKAGVSDYLLREFGSLDSTAAEGSFSVYVGFYASQARGRTIHSPKNCLPGAGWSALASGKATVSGLDGHQVVVNRYLLQNGTARALVLYWYQGRGRIANSEYAVKWELLRDAALHQRSDEALVRVVVPVGADEGVAFRTASNAAAVMIPALARALPE